MPYTTTTEIKIYYRIRGTGAPVLFLAGVSGDLRSLPSIFDSRLADSFELLAFDQRGTGQTEKPDMNYSMAQYANDAAALIQEVNWDSAHVVGVSFGGMVAQELALRYPQRVRSLVLCCTAAGGAGGSSYPIHELSGLTPDERSRLMLAIRDDRYNKAWQANHPIETERMLKASAANASPFLSEPGGITGLNRQIEARSHHDTYDRLRSIQIPTLVCGGEYDRQARPEVVRNLHGQIENAELCFFSGGHDFLNQDPNGYEKICEFIQRQCG